MISFLPGDTCSEKELEVVNEPVATVVDSPGIPEPDATLTLSHPYNFDVSDALSTMHRELLLCLQTIDWLGLYQIKVEGSGL